MKSIKQLVKKLNLGEITVAPQKMTGGLLHTVYKVTTTESVYVIKQLNAEVVSRAGALTNIEKSERIALSLQDKIPLIPAIAFDDHVIVKHDKSYYIIYQWHQGKTILANEVISYHCKRIGDILGKMHQVSAKSQHQSRQKMARPDICSWDKHIKRGQLVSAQWLDTLLAVKHKLENWQDKAIKAHTMLGEIQVISHRDLDPKNVLWQETEPLLIDWEAAGQINPYQELIEVINYWCLNAEGQLNVQFVEQLVDAYQVHYCINQSFLSTAVDSAYAAMLNWLDYNLRRSLETEKLSKAELELGNQEVFSTIQKLLNYQKNSQQLLKWFSVQRNQDK